MGPQIDLSTALTALTKILTAQLNVLNDEPPTDPPPPILSLIGATIFGFQSIYRVHLRVLITVPSSSSPDFRSNFDSNSESQNNPSQPQYRSRLVIWEYPALASNSSFSAAEVDEFMKTLGKVNVTSLKQDARECDICKTDFSHLPGAASSTNPTLASHAQEPGEQSFDDEELENPVRLACGHVYGEKCLKTWISGKGIGNLPTCPMCRAVLDSGSIEVSEVRITLDRIGALSHMY